MRFLFDQSAGFRLIHYLTRLGYDVQAISRDYPAGLPDEEVLAIAQREARILLTADRDFGELVVRQRLLHAGIILFRLPGATLETKIARLAVVLAEYRIWLDHRQLVVLTEGRVRVRRSR